MEDFITKQEGKLYRSLQELIHNCVDKIGVPKKPTINQLRKSQKVLTDYENYERQMRQSKSKHS